MEGMTPSWIAPGMEICKVWCHVICISLTVGCSYPVFLSCFSALQGDIIQEDDTQNAENQPHAVQKLMPNWKLTTNAFPEISKAEWGQGVEELPHSWLTLLAWTQEFLTQKWHLETPLPRSKAQQRREESSKAPDLWKRKRLHKTWGIWDRFQATGVTKEIVKQHNGVFCVFLNYPEGTVSPQYILPTVHIPQSSSQLWCSLTHTWISTGTSWLPILFFIHASFEIPVEF